LSSLKRDLFEFQLVLDKNSETFRKLDANSPERKALRKELTDAKKDLRRREIYLQRTPLESAEFLWRRANNARKFIDDVAAGFATVKHKVGYQSVEHQERHLIALRAMDLAKELQAGIKDGTISPLEASRHMTEIEDELIRKVHPEYEFESLGLKERIDKHSEAIRNIRRIEGELEPTGRLKSLNDSIDKLRTKSRKTRERIRKELDAINQLKKPPRLRELIESDNSYIRLLNEIERDESSLDELRDQLRATRPRRYFDDPFANSQP